jgi:ubiquitin C-terminal hydrolase
MENIHNIDQSYYGLAGFVNMGNTCYLNSVLQMLSNIPLFREYFISKKYHLQIIKNLRHKKCNIDNIDNITHIASEMTNTLSYQLERLLKAIWKTKNDSIPVYKPTSFRKLIAKKYVSFNNHVQQDVHECISAIFDLIEQDIECSTELVPYTTPNEQIVYSLFDEYNGHLDDDNISIKNKIDIKLLLRELEEKFPGYRKRYVQLLDLKRKYGNKYSIIDELFSIGNISTITCSNCKNKSYSYSSEYCISVEMPTDSPSELEIIEKMKSIVFPFEQKQTTNNFNFTIKRPRLDNVSYKLSSIFENDEPVTTDCEYISDVGESTSTEDINDGFDMFLDDSDDDSKIMFPQDKTIKQINEHNYSIPKEQLESIRRMRAIQAINSEREYSLEYCLDLYFRNESIECKCNYCNESKENTKSITLLNIPKYLIIHLKRFELDWINNRIIKKTQFINFSEDLDIAKYIDSDLLEHLKTSTKYKLINVINHYGVFESGHYYAYCKNSIDNSWYSFNDETVAHINNVNSQHAYILVYENQDE